MRFSFLAVLLCALHLSRAQTFPGFLPSTSNSLVIEFGSTVVNYSGQLLTQSLVENPPSVGLENALPGSFILVYIDPDALGDIETLDALHTIQTDLVPSDQTTTVGNTTFTSLVSNVPAIAPYGAPAPTYQSPPRPHRYTLLLFQQPPNFVFPSNFTSFLPLNTSNITNRYPFPILDFVESANLSLVAANWYDLENTTPPKSTATSSGTSSISTATSTSSPTASATGKSGSAPLHRVNTILVVLGVVLSVACLYIDGY
jgi:hypothetical protein